MRAELQAKFPAWRAAGQAPVGQATAGKLRARMWPNVRCGLVAGQVTTVQCGAVRAAGQEVAQYARRGGLRAEL